MDGDTFAATVRSKPAVVKDEKHPETQHSHSNMAVSSMEYNHKIDGQSNSVKMSTANDYDSVSAAPSGSGGVTSSSTSSGRGVPVSHGVQTQDNLPASQESRHGASLTKRKTSDSVYPASSTPTIPPGLHVMGQKPKKGSFQITRVIRKQQDHADPAEDADSIGDDYDETNTEDLSSEIMDTSKMTDIDQDPSSEDTVQSLVVEDLQREGKSAPVTLPQTKDEAPQDSKNKDSNVILPSPESKDDNSDPNFGENRFRIVKVPNERFLKGRWTCYDYHDSERTIREKSTEDLGSGNSSAASSVHYVPGVDDPSKNPLAAMSGSVYAENTSMSGNPNPVESQTGHSVSNVQATNGDYSAQSMTGVGTSGLAQVSTEQKGAHEMSSSIVQSASAISQPISSQHSQQPAGSYATTMTASGSSSRSNSQLRNQDYSSSSQDYIGQQANQQQPSTQKIPQQPPSQPQVPTSQDFNNGINCSTVQAESSRGQTDMSSIPLQQQANSTNVTDFVKNPVSVAGSGAQSKPSPSDNIQGSDFHLPDGIYCAPADDQQSTVSAEDDRGSDMGLPPLQKHIAMQGGIPGPLLELVGSRDPDDQSGASTVAIDNKIEQAMDLVKSHLMFAVREEVLVLKDQIKDLVEKNSQLEYENCILRKGATPETLAQLSQSNPGQSQSSNS